MTFCVGIANLQPTQTVCFRENGAQMTFCVGIANLQPTQTVCFREKQGKTPVCVGSRGGARELVTLLSRSGRVCYHSAEGNTAACVAAGALQERGTS